ncbi:MAG: DUF1294 domain-containing protein [Clostridia bacterium]|nr:DUF1294 domain-containing protein [Clostridia bacterium]
MKEYLFYAAVIYAAVGIASVILTAYDKAAAKKRKRRIPEQVLFFWAGIGGALPMLLTMKLINHKTRHKRFMLGLPAIIIAHTLLAIFLAVIIM